MFLEFWTSSFHLQPCQIVSHFLILGFQSNLHFLQAPLHFECINYFELQGFDLLVDWRQLPSFQKPHLDFLQIIMHLSECPGFLFPHYTFSLLTFSSFRFLSHTGSQVISPNQALFTSKFLLVLLTP